jgi:type IV pilus assembly protein PilC
MKVLETVHVAPVRSRGSGTPNERPAGAPPPTPSSHTGSARIRLSQKERLQLLEQFATLIDSGIQIASALQSMRQQCQEPRVAAVLHTLEQGVTAGLPLSSVMASMPRAFPAMLTQMVRAGEATGQLGEMMTRTVEMMEIEASMRSRVRSAMIYPGVMLALTVGVVVFLLTYIVPKFEKLFRGKPLPTPTRMLLLLGEGTREYGLWVLAALAVAAIAAFLFVRTRRGARALDGVLLHMPVVSGIYRTAAITRSIRTLGLLLQSGVPVHQALEHTEEVAASPALSALWRRARNNVVGGRSLLEAVRGSPLLGPTFEQLVAAGEATATLDRVMLKASQQYTKDLERRIRDLITLIEPAMVILMGGVVGFVALSIMLPIFQMSKS